MEKKMFYKADRFIFKRAQELRNRVTHTEMLMWGYLRSRPYGCKFRRQHPLYNYIADFYCHTLKLVIEIDGSIHNLADVKKSDEVREMVINSLGIEIVRFKNDQILYKLDFVKNKLNDYIQNKLTKKQKEGMSTPPLGGRGA